MHRRYRFSLLFVVLGFWVLFLVLPASTIAAPEVRPSAQGGVIVYTDRIAFLTAYPTVTVEGFETHQFSGSLPCLTPLSSASYTPCFHPGDLAPGAVYTRIGSGGLPAGYLTFAQSPIDTALVLRQATGVLEAVQIMLAVPTPMVALAASQGATMPAPGSMNTDDLFIGLIAYDANHNVVYANTTPVKAPGSLDTDDLFIGLISGVPIKSVELIPGGGSIALQEVMFGQ